MGMAEPSEVEAENTEYRDDEVLTEGPVYNAPQKKTRIKWVRVPLSRDELAAFNKRSNWLGFGQTLGYLGILFGGAGISVYSFVNWPWYVTAILVWLNGHSWQFTVNGFHELIHDSVFRQKWLNRSFLRLFSFLGWHNHHHFWASHTEHHKYALHPPDDQEVVLPTTIDFASWPRTHFVHYRYPWDVIKGKLKSFSGHIPQDPWSQIILPESDPERRAAYTRWERVMLIGHLAIAAAAVASGYWIVILVVTFPKMFGRWLQNRCNSAQHVGLTDNVPDFRLCCRTIYLNWFVQFLYWHMNYHTEHHMYAAVPCYRLPALHKRIKHAMPWCPNGLKETWDHIREIHRRQEEDPTYQYTPELPKGQFEETEVT